MLLHPGRLATYLPQQLKTLALTFLRQVRKLRFAFLSQTRWGRSRIFTRIHKTNFWGSSESASGIGSTLDQTAAIRSALPQLFYRLSIRVLLDAPCGDAKWIRHISNNLHQYIGVDVVPNLILGLNERAQDNEIFYLADIVSDPLPPADAILCRDALVHMPLKQAVATIQNFRLSEAQYLIATTFPGRSNTELPAGHWRPLNLSVAPFNLGTPIALINEKCTEGRGRYADKCLGVWPLQSSATESDFALS
jgi:SAM-dependent methyltransferase